MLLYYFSLERRNLLCYCLNVFKQNKIARWHHCNANNFKTLRDNFIPIRVLYANKITEYVGKFHFKFLAIADKTGKKSCRTLYIGLYTGLPIGVGCSEINASNRIRHKKTIFMRQRV